MTASDSRLKSIFAGLTARERGLLVLRAWKEGEDEDPEVRRAMPERQMHGFNRYIDLMTGVNHGLGPHALVLSLHTDLIDQRFGWLASLRLWRLEAITAAGFIFFRTKEPVTVSEHARLVETARARMAPLGECAELLAERFDGWAEGDLEPPTGDENDNGPWVRDGAWSRVRAEKKRQLAGLVEAGAIVGQKVGRRLLVNTGSFYDWLGEPVPLHPDRAIEYEVLPDEQADPVKRLREERWRAFAALGAPPHDADQDVGVTEVSAGEGPGEPPDLSDEALDGLLLASIKAGLLACWQKLRAIERVVNETAEEFDGEDPALPQLRELLDGTRSQLTELRDSMSRLGEEVELPEPDEGLVEWMREIAMGEPQH